MWAAATSSASRSRRRDAVERGRSLGGGHGQRSSTRTPSKRSVSGAARPSPPARTSARISRTAATGSSLVDLRAAAAAPPALATDRGGGRPSWPRGGRGGGASARRRLPTAAGDDRTGCARPCAAARCETGGPWPATPPSSTTIRTLVEELQARVLGLAQASDGIRRGGPGPAPCSRPSARCAAPPASWPGRSGCSADPG